MLREVKRYRIKTLVKKILYKLRTIDSLIVSLKKVNYETALTKMIVKRHKETIILDVI
jgi:hypothetical protein